MLGLIGIAYGQTIGYLRYDTVKIYTTKVGGRGSLDVTGAAKFTGLLAKSAGTDSVIVRDVNGYFGTVAKSSLAGSSWLITGNTGIDTSVNWLGTNDANDLKIVTNGVRRFTVNTNGALGIGAPADYGTSGYVLQSAGSGAAPGWVAPSNSQDTFYILASGQSNSAGTADNDIDTAYDSRLQGWDSTTNAWVNLRVGYAPMFQTFANGGANSAYSPSAQWYFARKLAREKNCIVRVVNLAMGNSSIDLWWNGGPQQYLLEIDSMSSSAAIPGYDLFIWDQGESDNAMIPSLYAAKWDSMKTWLREHDYFPKTTKIVAVGMPRYYNNAIAGIQGIDPTLQGFSYNLDQWDGYATTDSAEINQNPASDGGGSRKIHFDSEGLQYLGEQSIWAAWKSLPTTYGQMWSRNDTMMYSNPEIPNIGIQTNAPAYPLDVHGDINIRDSFGLRIKDSYVIRARPDSGTYYFGGAGNYGQGLNTVGIGSGALAVNTKDNNVAVGAAALASNTTANGNTAFGTQSLTSNTIGGFNTAAGFQALLSNSTGGSNVAIGTQALYSSTSSNNVAVGVYSGYSTTGSGNTFLGYFTGQGSTSGSSNTVLGANITTGNGSNRIFIGNGGGSYQAYHDGSDWTLTGKVGINGTAPNSTLSTNGSISLAYVSKSNDYTADITDGTIEVTATGKTITLPTAVGITGRIYTVKLTANGTGTVATTSSQTIDGGTSYSLASQYKYLTVQSNGANWIVISNN